MSRRMYLICFLSLIPLWVLAEGRASLLIADFESGAWDGWYVEGDAFDTVPSHGTLPGQQTVQGYEGEWLVNSFHGGDSTTGFLQSDPFLIERSHINFRIGGGANGGCHMDLVVRGEVVYSICPEVSEELLKWNCWDVSAWEGDSAVIRIVDNEQGGWGHICVDHIEQADNIVIGAFEGGTYGSWKIDGDAFGVSPAKGAFEGQNAVAGFGGKGLVNTFLGGDGARGTLRSPLFEITKPYIHFRLGGGFDRNLLHVDLLIGGEIVRRSAPIEWIERPNDAQQERLYSRTWDVSEYIGDTAYIVITDAATGGWGHINADDFIQTDYRSSYLEDNYTLRLVADGSYLQIPTQNWNPFVNLTIRSTDGQILSTQRLRLAHETVDRYIPVYIGNNTGEQIDIIAGVNVTNSVYADSIHVTKEAGLTPQEDPFRPIYHHHAAYGWASDPNGMIYHNGIYHLFYQHYPYDPHWNMMHWGHATSTDLVHWEQHPIALFPDGHGQMYSGNIVADDANTAGFGAGALVAVYTTTVPTQAQSLAYSLDDGMTWQKYGEPVLTGSGDFRDPKVFWFDDWNRWVMILANGYQIEIYSSSNLREWHRELGWGGHVGAHGGVWECPDLIKIPVEGTDEYRWVMIVSVSNGAVNTGSGIQYFIGEFTGNDFILQTDGAPRWVDYGKDNYAGVTWFGKRDEKGRPIFIGWMSNWDYCNATPYPWSPFRGQHTFPRALSLVNTPDGLKLKSEPVSALELLRSENSFSPQIGVLHEEWHSELISAMTGGAYIIEMDLASGKHSWKLTMRNEENEFVAVGYNALTNEVYLDRKNSGIVDIGANFATSNHVALLHPDEHADRVTLLVDRSSVEFFVNSGRLVFSDLVFPTAPYDRLTLNPEGHPLAVSRLKVTEISHDKSTAVEELYDRREAPSKAAKRIENGQIVIHTNNNRYNVLGMQIK